MKKIVFLLVNSLFSLMLLGQAPQAFKYQLVTRDSEGSVFSNHELSFRITLIPDHPDSTGSYTEVHHLTTNEYGLVSMNIGEGEVVSGSFNELDWGAHAYYLKVETDTTGGSGFLYMGTSELLSVPYALYAQTSGKTLAGGDDINMNLDTSNSFWTANGSHIYNNNPGRVGIGESSPLARFQVKDSAVVFTGTYPLPGLASPVPLSGQGTRLLWYPDKAAFRSGTVSGNVWDKDSIGLYSLAAGYNAKARGSYSFAFGNNSSATGQASTAFGENVRSGGWASTAFGYQTNAGNWASTAFGYLASASGTGSTAFGHGTLASGDGATAFGEYTTASGLNATAFGRSNSASGTGATAFGGNNLAGGTYATATGYNTNAQSYCSFVTGRYNLISGNSASWIDTDPLFVVGNGSDGTNRRNALTLLKNGRLGLGVASPAALLDLWGSANAWTTSTWNVALQLPQASVLKWTSNGFNTRHGIGQTNEGLLFFSSTSDDASTPANYHMLITNAGRIGINTLAPGAQLALESPSLGISAGNTVDWVDLAGYSANRDHLYVHHYRYANGGDWHTAEIRLQKWVDVTPMQYISFKGNPALGILEFGFGSTAHMTLNSNGFLAVSAGGGLSSFPLSVVTSNPGSWSGYFENNAEVCLAHADGNGLFINTHNSSSSGYALQLKTSSVVAFPPILYCRNDGRVGIGTAFPEYSLDIEANSNFLRLTKTGVSTVYQFDVKSTGAFGLQQNGNSKIYISPAGMVTIGSMTNADPYRLRVSGDAYATGQWVPSDEKFKKNIDPIQGSMEIIDKITGSCYEWRKEEFPDMNFDDRKHFGVIAQEVEQILPQLVKTDQEGEKAVAYNEFIPILIEAVKELKRQNEALVKSNGDLVKRVEMLENK